MRWLDFRQSILGQLILRLVMPMAIILCVLLISGYLLYQRTLSTLIIDRDLQLATLVAARISAVLDANSQTLVTLATNTDARVTSNAGALLKDAAEVLKGFDGGTAVVDTQGQVRSQLGASAFGLSVASQDFFQRVRDYRSTVYSSVITHATSGRNMVVIAVPIKYSDERFAGALLGAIYLENPTLIEPIRRFSIGQSGFAYVLDKRGHVVAHPDEANLGHDFTDRPFARDVMLGRSGGTIFDNQDNQRIVSGYVPIGNTGWGLIVREPWEDVVAPVALYTWMIVIAGLALFAVAFALLWQGVRKINAPVRALAQQAQLVAEGESVQPIKPVGLYEIDTLGQTFAWMASRIEQYRAGLRRYVGSVTQSQEDERKRLARELHDETTQNLIAISRQLEIYQATEQNVQRQGELSNLRLLLSETLRGVRRISRDLRPPALEDLGLVPALEGLSKEVQSALGAPSHVQFHVQGQVKQVGANEELALYRIAQESLANIRKHAHASHAILNLNFNCAAVEMEIIDDGVGFVMPASITELAENDHFGLIGMQERTWSVGGSLQIRTDSRSGTQVMVKIPLSVATT